MRLEPHVQTRVGEVLNESCNRSVEMSVYISGPSRKSFLRLAKIRSSAAIPTRAHMQVETMAIAIHDTIPSHLQNGHLRVIQFVSQDQDYSDPA